MNKKGSNQGSSSGITDVKYQKAIKQISKLISLNTSLKKQVVTLQQNYQKLKSDYDTLQQNYNNLSLQHQQNKQTPATGPESTTTNESKIQSVQLLDSRKKEKQELSTQQFLENKRKIQNLEEKLVQKQQKVNKIRIQLEQKVNENKEMIRRNIDLSEEINRLKANQNFKGFKDIEQQKNKLQKQLQQSRQVVTKISNDYQMLKKQLLFNGKSSINAKSIEIGLGMSASVGALKDPLSDFYFQKLRQIQTENMRLKKQLSEKKQRYKQQIMKLKDQNQAQLGKLMNLTSFVEKQQVFIEKFMLAEKEELGQ